MMMCWGCSQPAKVALVSAYAELRQRDVHGSNAYRITVRQLESLIRLSEALARMHLSEWVTAHYVDEAYRLLSKSIVHVERGHIAELDDGPSALLAEPLGLEAATA